MPAPERALSVAAGQGRLPRLLGKQQAAPQIARNPAVSTRQRTGRWGRGVGTGFATARLIQRRSDLHAP